VSVCAERTKIQEATTQDKRTLALFISVSYVHCADREISIYTADVFFLIIVKINITRNVPCTKYVTAIETNSVINSLFQQNIIVSEFSITVNPQMQ